MRERHTSIFRMALPGTDGHELSQPVDFTLKCMIQYG